MTEPVRSVLYDVQAEQGAVFEDYDGWIWTLNLGDSLGEYAALRDDVVMWDVYGLVKWDVRGADAVAAVQLVFTNAIGALEPGQVRYGTTRASRSPWATPPCRRRSAMPRRTTRRSSGSAPGSSVARRAGGPRGCDTPAT